MKLLRVFAISTTAVVMMAGSALAKPPSTCDPTAVSNANAAIAADCPCDGKTDPSTGAVVPWKNHGQYVSCVAKSVKAQGRANGVSRRCLKGAVPCAANSTCGKGTSVACQTTTGTCLGDPTPGDLLAEGTCDYDGTVACDTDADCSQSTCAVMSSEECTAAGGTATTGSCCN